MYGIVRCTEKPYTSAFRNGALKRAEPATQVYLTMES